MTEQSYFMGQDGFVWFVGVVEDRNDPELLGRVRVRCLGFHTDNLDDLPSSDLPWAHVMHPVTDPSMQGLGSTPSFLVEGSWVIGFFRDAYEKQQPVIIGSLPGAPASAANPDRGFNDPRSPNSKQDQYKGTPRYGPYPVDGKTYEMPSGHEYGEADTNRLAQGETSETHNSLLARRRNRLRGDPTKVDETVGVDDDLFGASAPTDEVKGTGIPTATQPFLKTPSDVAVEETRGFWEEPHPKSIQIDEKPYISSQYPYNHVHETESGHIREIDDSPGSERLFTQHMSGTFEEIHPDGSKVVKIVGDNYEIVAGASNVSITGNVNLTVAGTVRELIRGDYHLEVEGNYTQKIHKNHRVKVGAGGVGNREEEILGNHSYNINDDVKARIGGNVTTTIEKDDWKLINGKMTTTVVKDIDLFSQTADINIVASNNLTTNSASGITSFKSGSTLNIKSATLMHIKSETTIDMDATTEVDIDSATINLN
jgi:hypothetical protein|tara:strand:- start:1402 stop:2850 length:1449 start_codon:yes stop_codon:yes gene_type:complete